MIQILEDAFVSRAFAFNLFIVYIGFWLFYKKHIDAYADINVANPKATKVGYPYFLILLAVIISIIGYQSWRFYNDELGIKGYLLFMTLVISPLLVASLHFSCLKWMPQTPTLKAISFVSILLIRVFIISLALVALYSVGRF